MTPAGLELEKVNSRAGGRVVLPFPSSELSPLSTPEGTFFWQAQAELTPCVTVTLLTAAFTDLFSHSLQALGFMSSWSRMWEIDYNLKKCSLIKQITSLQDGTLDSYFKLPPLSQLHWHTF